MTNIDRAAELLIHWADSEGGLSAIDRDYDGDLTGGAEALADAGLLAPDLPEPTDPGIPEWEMPSNDHHAVSVGNHGTVRIWGDTSGYTPAEARDLAAALLAAAAWAEARV